ncbi:caspase-3-like isoform X1 [Dreissena polymorpha]|uniref:Caspase-3 n=2 Tax=Dreissena polymorpha TaxID=45954 RepID=A0A9D4H690_DREPO|nr:caspase-3-like isoform X1 [Dreissena polymorpha]XP_052276721.1 caspase-3-like isoform X1 [Dreissena polymorpha]XP_052276722.1 caspase-3-like isoform X1 [Dreissena polymorpha]XP_052276723.1 caspase-3-like isoform X1 [Dreissena polymorpha]XP_052276724.1 caspase-3-like isoform X1 [Dreissena polymorpha]XP_052276725.1 caspase-3-like isoform X1 [Dreissena polymorpha]KAH3830356.1 hypothetical protein DPMN_103598 [Dreissena polymorpha]
MKPGSGTNGIEIVADHPLNDHNDAIGGESREGVDMAGAHGVDAGGSSSTGSSNAYGSSVDAKGLSIFNKRPQEQPGPARRPLINLEVDSYDVTHRERGHALIINQETFSVELNRRGFTRRTGTAVDERNISRKLKAMGFQVKSYPDLKASQIRSVCAKMAAQDHSDSDMFLFVILTHGEEGIVFGTDEGLEIQEVAGYFKGDKCPSLVGKPKLFFIQACRGYKTDAGVHISVTDALPASMKGSDSIKLPVEADFLFAYSTVPGYYSWRNGTNGSWFIQALCAVLDMLGDEPVELQKILIALNRKVAQSFESNNPGNADFHQMKQVPAISSMLTKDLFLTRKK